MINPNHHISIKYEELVLPEESYIMHGPFVDIGFRGRIYFRKIVQYLPVVFFIDAILLFIYFWNR